MTLVPMVIAVQSLQQLPIHFARKKEKKEKKKETAGEDENSAGYCGFQLQDLQAFSAEQEVSRLVSLDLSGGQLTFFEWWISLDYLICASVPFRLIFELRQLEL